MKNPTGNKLEKLVFRIFDQMVEGADKYVTKQGSTWLIFTEDKRWVVEFTKDKTLWFNYNLFQSELELIGKNCTEEKDLIKNWFESRFLNTNGVRHAKYLLSEHQPNVEDTIQNGVRHTEVDGMRIRSGVKDAIQEGVKETRFQKSSNLYRIEDTRTLWGKSGDEGVVEYIIQEGVKDTTTTRWARKDAVENTIQNGVKHTEDGDWLDQDERIDDIIQNGVKETREVTFLNQMFIEETIENGVKDTKKSHWIKFIEAEDIIENGICDVKHSYDFEEIVVKDIIEDSYPHKHRVEGVIKNTVKDGI
jgi:predicted transcriptional regulator